MNQNYTLGCRAREWPESAGGEGVRDPSVSADVALKCYEQF